MVRFFVVPNTGRHLLGRPLSIVNQMRTECPQIHKTPRDKFRLLTFCRMAVEHPIAPAFANLLELCLCAVIAARPHCKFVKIPIRLAVFLVAGATYSTRNGHIPSLHDYQVGRLLAVDFFGGFY